MKPQILDKKTGARRDIDDIRHIALDRPSVVHLKLAPEKVARYERRGDDLVMTLKDGGEITIQGFFVKYPDADMAERAPADAAQAAADGQARNDLMLEDDNDVTWWGQYPEQWTEFHFTEIEFGEAAAAAVWWPWLLGALGVVGLGALIAGSGDGGDRVPPNNAPVAADDVASASEDGGPVTGALLANDRDPDGDALSVTRFTISGTAYNAGETATIEGVGKITIDRDGRYTFTPEPNWNGTVPTITYTISDGKGGADTGDLNITVTPVNDPPVLADPNDPLDPEYPGQSFDPVTGDYAQTTPEDTPVDGRVVGEDLDGDDLTYTVQDQPAHGTVTVDPITGEYTYAPGENYVGEDSFTVLIDDGNGGTVVSTVTITVTPVNHPPVLADPNDPLDPEYPGQTFDPVTGDYTVVTDEDTVVSGRVSAADADGDTLTYNVTADPSHGSLVFNSATGGYTYTPNADWNGADSFDVAISDGNGGITITTVIVNVGSVVDIADDTATVGNGQSVVIGVLDNDEFEGADAEVTGVGTAAHGTVTINADGTVTYTAEPGYVGSDSFTYTVTSGGVTETATVNVTVTGAPQVTVTAGGDVYEEALSNGIVDAANAGVATAVTTGTITISDVDTGLEGLRVSLVGPIDITVGGKAVTWAWDEATGTLTGTADVRGVLTPIATVELSDVSAGGEVGYTVTLLHAIDHADPGSQDARDLNFTVSVDDGEHSTDAILTVAVVDDAPMVSPNTMQTTPAIKDVYTNLMIVLDTSGSMNNSAGAGLGTRLAVAKEAIEELIDAYEDAGEVMVNIAVFGTSASSASSGWVSAATALGLLAGISTSGQTNYDAALAQAIASWTDTTGQLTNAGVQNVTYFLTDGEPTRGDGDPDALINNSGASSSDAGISAAEAAIWQNFLTASDITAYALAMGTGISNTATIDMIAYDGVTSTPTEALLVTDMSQLSAVLQGLVNVADTSGNLVTGNGSVDQGFGADGGSLTSLTLDGTTYTYTWGSDDPLSVTGSATYTFDSNTHEVVITTAPGGTLTVNFATGDYSYSPNASATTGYQESIGLTLVDADGDSGAGKLTIYVSTTGADSFVWDGAGAVGGIDGGDGSDTVTLANLSSVSGETLGSVLSNIETLDLTSDLVAITNLRVQDVLDITGSSSGTLTINGDSEDMIQLSSAAEWSTDGIVTGGYVAYTSMAGITLLIDEDIYNSNHVSYAA